MPLLTSRAAVGQDAAGAHVLAAAEDLDTLRLVGKVLDVGALGEEAAAVEHEERECGLEHAGRGSGPGAGVLQTVNSSVGVSHSTARKVA